MEALAIGRHDDATSEVGAKYLPLDPCDFAFRPYVEHSGWPFDAAHLDRFYERHLAGEKIRTGWVNAGDFEPAALD